MLGCGSAIQCETNSALQNKDQFLQKAPIVMCWWGIKNSTRKYKPQWLHARQRHHCNCHNNCAHKERKEGSWVGIQRPQVFPLFYGINDEKIDGCFPGVTEHKKPSETCHVTSRNFTGNCFAESDHLKKKRKKCDGQIKVWWSKRILVKNSVNRAAVA